MSEVSFINSKKQLETHIRRLISMPIEEFQRVFEVTITSVDIEFIDVSTKTEQPINIINKIKITIQ